MPRKWWPFCLDINLLIKIYMPMLEVWYHFRLEETVAVRKRFDPDELYSLLSKVSLAMKTIEKFISTVAFTSSSVRIHHTI